MPKRDDQPAYDRSLILNGLFAIFILWLLIRLSAYSFWLLAILLPLYAILVLTAYPKPLRFTLLNIASYGIVLSSFIILAWMAYFKSLF